MLPISGWNDFIPKFSFILFRKHAFIETERITLGLLVLFHRFMLSIVHKLHGHAIPLPLSYIPRLHRLIVGSWAFGLNFLMNINIGLSPSENLKLWSCCLHLHPFERFQLCWIPHGPLLCHESPSWSEEFLCIERLCRPFLSSKGISRRG